MKKIMLLLLAVLAVFFIGCASAPEPEPEPEATPIPAQLYPPKLIEHKTSAMGGDVPEWVFMSSMELEEQEAFADTYVFVVEAEGQNKESAKMLAESMDAPKEVSRMVSVEVKNKFVGAQVGDEDMLETYMEEVVKVVSEAEFSGARNRGDFWVYQQYYNDDGTPSERIYRFLYLYTVPRDHVDAAIQRALEEAGTTVEPKTEEEETARARVKELFDSEGL